MATSDFSVMIGQPTLVAPETLTPHEFKYLSNIDDQMGLCNHIPFIHVYRGPQNGPGCDSGPIIRQTLSRTLVHYYPLVGRLRNGVKEKLVVEYIGEGMVYRDADVDVTIKLLCEATGGIRSTYYGAAVVFPCAITDASDLGRPLKTADNQITASKSVKSNDEYRSSTVDFMEVNKRRGFYRGLAAFVVSDMSRLRFAAVDFGWGQGIYGGRARAGTGAVPWMLKQSLKAFLGIPKLNLEK
ncbi:benzyl alcohol O-benzoyltransferase-like [Asparagus officinalis]|uniref:benzyl alcohol O-benzoyltransferase-like n=1 Tax=Asparagus officinalis TaxID=4686 RepID=UPI00098E1AF2|nr:benzyl alcohol O-benzoyltransferase-like [Asparagus officinalis]